MDFKVILATFAAVLVAELADKTQLVGIGMASKTLKPVSVFVGSVVAYAIITGVSVFVGAVIGKYLNPIYLRYGGAILFIVLGVLMFFDRL
ncbi:MAG: TMEM165/GDT1 family protein [Candidatus Omnitrophica bacterium]|nr:TMEM165/GDT1 family protein [Candidatus Omnitrophota bacterium]